MMGTRALHITNSMPTQIAPQEATDGSLDTGSRGQRPVPFLA